MKKFVFLPVAAALALAGCSSTPEAEPTASPTIAEAVETTAPATSATSSTAGESESQQPADDSSGYAFATGMTFGKFTLPGKPDDGFLKIMKRYDDADELGDVSFVNIKIDNRQADEKAWVTEVRVYDEAGSEYLYVSPVDLLDAMFEKDQSKMDYESEYMKYFDKYNTQVSQGAVGTETLISLDPLPKDIARVIVNTGGFAGDIEAVTIEDAKSQGYPLDF